MSNRHRSSSDVAMNASESVTVDEAIGCESVSVTCCRLGCPNDVVTAGQVIGNASVHLRVRCGLAASHANAIDGRNGNESASGLHCDDHGCANESGICI